MKRISTVLLLLGGLPAAEEAPAIRLVRDLTRLPRGSYEIVQSYDGLTRETIEEPGKEVAPTERRTSNTFTFDLKVEGSPPVATVTVRRVQIRIEGEKTLAYDSDAPAAEQPEAIREQFRHLVGRTAKVDLAKFGRGTGFAGLDAAWADYLKENPDKAKWAEANRRNYGDGRLDRMFLRGVDVLFGKDAGRADGRTLELKAGQSFEVTLEEPGIAWEPTALTHACTVRSATEDEVVLEVAWQENGLRPTVDDEGGVIVRGGDMKCSTTMTFRVDGGLLVGLAEDLTRTDQVSNGAVQKTLSTTERTELSIRRR